MKKSLKIIIRGRLHNAGFRFKTMEAAYKFDIKGIVKYLADRSIYIEAEGDESQLEEFLQWCRKGPLGAKVREVLYEESEFKDYAKFDIVSGTHTRS